MSPSIISRLIVRLDEEWEELEVLGCKDEEDEEGGGAESQDAVFLPFIEELKTG